MEEGRELTRDEILNASPEQLREWVAVHIMGWEKQYSPDPTLWAWSTPDGTGCTEETWNDHWIGNWAGNMAHAWEVVEKVSEPASTMPGAELPPNTIFMFLFERGYVWAMDAKEAAESICRWALIAVMGATDSTYHNARGQSDGKGDLLEALRRETL